MLMLCGLSAIAQNKEITGKVIDDKGLPVAGASVIIKGTSKGVSANTVGEFSISAKPNDALVITATNFEKIEVKVGN